MKINIYILCRIALFLATISLFSSCGIIRAAWFFLPNTDDYRHDPHRAVEPPAEPFRFAYSSGSDSLGRKLSVFYRFVQNAMPLDEFVEMHDTEAFLIIRNDTILYERYPNGHSAELPVSTFSVSKSVMTTLIGIAIHQGHLNGKDQRISEILPEWDTPHFTGIRVRHLLEHTSGIRFSKSVANLSSDQVQFYYGKNLRRRMARRTSEHPPGQRFNYHSANTQLLGLVLEGASGQTLSEYLETHLWQPLGMAAPAFWSLDRKGEKGIERAFCCLQAQAIDFAKLGRLWLHDGYWNGRQLLPPGWMEEVLDPGRADCGPYRCGFTVTGSDCNLAFFASGLMGQFIYVVPDKNLLILRFGQHRKGYSANLWRDLLGQLADKL